MKKKLLNILAIAGIIILVGCKGPAPKYNPPKAKTVSSAITGTPIKVKYSIDTDYNEATYDYHEYYLFLGNSKTAFATTDINNRRNRNIELLWKLFDINTPQVYLYGTLGDKIVFTFHNGFSGGSPLAVYDHSERKTYYLTDGDEEYMFFKKGTSYVVKLLKQKKYIALNNLKEVKIDESQYTVLKMDFVTSGRRFYKTDPRAVMKSYVVGSFISMRDKAHRLPPLLFGPPQQKVPLSFGRSSTWQ